MLKKMKRRFIASAMVAFGAVMLVLVTVINIANCYSDYISQNLIYITEKYLFPVALRNVAFIISRKGFDLNAQKATFGCLKESAKLIISLDDNDLIKMIYMKENGEEPSDYLLDKVEQILMSVSK